MTRVQVTIQQIHSAITICQLAIHQARKENESTAFYEFLVKEYITSHLNGEYEITI